MNLKQTHETYKFVMLLGFKLAKFDKIWINKAIYVKLGKTW